MVGVASQPRNSGPPHAPKSTATIAPWVGVQNSSGSAIAARVGTTSANAPSVTAATNANHGAEIRDVRLTSGDMVTLSGVAAQARTRTPRRVPETWLRAVYLDGAAVHYPAR